MTDKIEKAGWGGKRENAGPKPKTETLVPLTVNVTSKQYEFARAAGAGKLVRDLLAAHMKTSNRQ